MMLPHCRSSAGLRAGTHGPPITLHFTSRRWMSQGSSLHCSIEIYYDGKSFIFTRGSKRRKRVTYFGPRTRFPRYFARTRGLWLADILFNGSIACQTVRIVKCHLFVIWKRTDADDCSLPDTTTFTASYGTMLPRSYPPSFQQGKDEFYSITQYSKCASHPYLGGQDCLLQTRDFSRGFSSPAQYVSSTRPASFSIHLGGDTWVPPPQVAVHTDQSVYSHLNSGFRVMFSLGTVYSYFTPGFIALNRSWKDIFIQMIF